jgi:hypothetical protein
MVDLVICAFFLCLPLLSAQSSQRLRHPRQLRKAHQIPLKRPRAILPHDSPTFIS